MRPAAKDLVRRGTATPSRVCRHVPGHPLTGAELRALRRLEREAKEAGTLTPFVFTSERGTPFTTAGFARMIERAAEAAKLKIKAHPHMLRHACGFKLANDGVDTRALQAYLGTATYCPRTMG